LFFVFRVRNQKIRSKVEFKPMLIRSDHMMTVTLQPIICL